MSCLTRWRWRGAGLAVCLLFAVGAILHVAHATPAHAHAASEIMTVSDGSAPCEPGHAAGKHCQPTNGCPLCAPLGAAMALSGTVLERPAIDAGALLPGRAVDPHFHPPRFSLHA